MALTDAEELRLEVVEKQIIKLQTAVRNLASKQQIRQLLLLKQTEVDDLTKRVAELERLVTILQNSL